MLRKLSIPFVLVAIVGCTQSDLDRCIDSQVAVWEQQMDDYGKLTAIPRADPYDPNDRFMVGNVEVSGEVMNSLGRPRHPGTREEAEAQAILRCGDVQQAN